MAVVLESGQIETLIQSYLDMLVAISEANPDTRIRDVIVDHGDARIPLHHAAPALLRVLKDMDR